MIDAVKWFQPIGQVNGTPVLAPDGTLYVGDCTEVTGLYAFNSDTGALKWTFPTRDSVIAPSIGTNGTIYFGSCDQYVRALRPDGTRLWRFRASGDVHRAPTVAPDKTILFISSDWVLFAVNSDTGALKWKAPLGAPAKQPRFNWGTDVAAASSPGR